MKLSAYLPRLTRKNRDREIPRVIDEKTKKPQGGMKMPHYAMVLLRGAGGFLAAALLAGMSQVPAVICSVSQGSAEPALLAQKAEAGSDQTKSPPPSPAKPRKMKKAAAPAPAQERDSSKSGGFSDELDRAGTKKIGGEVIRNKDE
jgi:hypothetical protein